MDENKMTQTGERLLTVDNLKTTFMIHKTKVEAVRGASIHVDDGDILAVVGESGSGKSVLMKSIMGLLPENAQTTADSLVYMGRNLLEFSADERRKMRGKEFAMIFQDPMTALNPLKKIGAHLTEVLMRYRKLNKKQAREEAIEALRKVGIPSPEKRLDQYPHEFSGGMRQRVLIAMALCCKPKLLIADEPTTALDVTIQAQILELLKQLRDEEKISVVFITHDLGVDASLKQPYFRYVRRLNHGRRIDGRNFLCTEASVYESIAACDSAADNRGEGTIGSYSGYGPFIDESAGGMSVRGTL